MGTRCTWDSASRFLQGPPRGVGALNIPSRGIVDQSDPPRGGSASWDPPKDPTKGPQGPCGTGPSQGRRRHHWPGKGTGTLRGAPWDSGAPRFPSRDPSQGCRCPEDPSKGIVDQSDPPRGGSASWDPPKDPTKGPQGPCGTDVHPRDHPGTARHHWPGKGTGTLRGAPWDSGAPGFPSGDPSRGVSARIPSRASLTRVTLLGGSASWDPQDPTKGPQGRVPGLAVPRDSYMGGGALWDPKGCSSQGAFLQQWYSQGPSQAVSPAQAL
ncbi:collagen alpha-1(I) chain-like [Homarus americanus]|uniref:collagen alpha-1(I) chain-like n=1 Tax=Homarus americanus TaxID=6706 RepID=UPI001C4553DE|nr:collagen alpha-1(I) chain-like [Homarus americanus]